MATRIFFLGLVVLAVATMTAQAAILFEDDFDGTTLDTSKWTASGTGTVVVSGGNVKLDVPPGTSWEYSQIDSVPTWLAADGDLYYSFTIGGAPEGNNDIFQIFEGTAQTGYVAMRNDAGAGGWIYDAREAAAGSASYRSTNVQTLGVGDVFTLKLGPSGSAAYKNGVMIDSSAVVPAGTLMVDAQSWREPGGSALQTFDYISVSDTATPTPNPIPGDANIDGVVNDVDASILADNWQSTDAIWGQGDFNGDTVVDDVDATLLAANWQPASSTASVPEPSMLVMLIAGLVVLAWRKRGVFLR